MNKIFIILICLLFACKKETPIVADPIETPIAQPVNDTINYVVKEIVFKLKPLCYSVSGVVYLDSDGVAPYDSVYKYTYMSEVVVKLNTKKRFLVYFFNGYTKPLAGVQDPCNYSLNLTIQSKIITSFDNKSNFKDTIDLYK